MYESKHVYTVCVKENLYILKCALLCSECTYINPFLELYHIRIVYPERLFVCMCVCVSAHVCVCVPMCPYILCLCACMCVSVCGVYVSVGSFSCYRHEV